jgi:hypothetical protein
MIELRRLAPHDPLPEGGPYVVAMRRLAEDDPDGTVTIIAVVLCTKQDDGSVSLRDDDGTVALHADGTPMEFEEAIAAAETLAKRKHIKLVCAVDRTLGPREAEVLAHHGDHGFASETLEDEDQS